MSKKKTKQESVPVEVASIFVRGVELFEGTDFKQEGNKLFPLSSKAKKVFKR